MALTRTRLIAGVVGLVILISLGYGLFLLVGPSAKYRGLNTTMQVEMDEATRAYAETQLKTSQASLAAAQAKGGEIDLNLYATVAHYAYIIGDLVTAREALEAELKGNPINYGARNSYGSVLEKMGDYSGARKAYEQALADSAGQGPEALYVSLLDLLLAHFPTERDAAKTLLETSVTKKGQSSWNMMQLGRWYLAEGDCQRAIDHYTVAKTLSPKNQSIADELQQIVQSCKM